ncbi:type I polyketide synthase, partial [Azospirillum sp. B506]|uniref:type I polyketide synthase n=1 Tax=Azospirillum sp. B506 TaxID=137721 RepID=UPI0005B2665F
MSATPPPDTKAALKDALIELRRLRAENEELRRHGTAEPVAVVGMSCRFPGQADSPDAFWRLLTGKGDAVREIPPDRWDIDAHFDPDPAAPGKMNSRWGGFLDGIDRFDAAFFDMTPREAARTDPQHRLFLEVAWEALEDAGIPADRLRGSRTGVFLGIMGHDYYHRQLAEPDMYTALGNGSSFAGARLAYFLDLHGPVVPVETACSSSLVAVHMACAALARQECDAVLAGGVNLIVSPETSAVISKTYALSSDGRCRSFDARANGFVRSEGCGVIVLKRLADATRDGDRILAVISGSAINHDGRSVGLTAPNGRAQEAVIRHALATARIDPARVTLVETHGSGTPLGDAIELEALKSVYDRPGTPPCALCAVKSNLGHLEAAAGIAGLIKVMLAMRHGTLPANLHFQSLNPQTSLAGSRCHIPTATQPWPGTSRRVAGISAFGFSGTNAHVIVEEAPESTASEPMPEAAAPRLLVLSARSEPALRALAGALAQHLTGPAAPALADACFTAACRRSHHPVRAAVLADDRAGLAQALTSLAAGTADERTAPPPATPALSPGAPGIVFIFPGQGSQWLGMGRDLLAREPVFRTALETCDAAILAETGWSVIAELQAAEADSRLGETAVVQPVLFALQVALAALWRSWGIVPAAVVGHSMGETAAAHVAGALSLAAAVRVICRRSRLLDRLRGQGAMALVELSLAEAHARLADWPGV